MKANELMIGDWLTHKGNPIQISTIGIACATGGDDDDFKMMHFLDLSPIPITPEILEKNGFNLRENIVVGGPKFVHEQDEGRTEIVIWLQDGMFMEVRKNIYYEDEICYTLPVPFFVHELQHALRLVGIKKEIVL